MRWIHPSHPVSRPTNSHHMHSSHTSPPATVWPLRTKPHTVGTSVLTYSSQASLEHLHPKNAECWRRTRFFCLASTITTAHPAPVDARRSPGLGCWKARALVQAALIYTVLSGTALKLTGTSLEIRCVSVEISLDGEESGGGLVVRTFSLHLQGWRILLSAVRTLSLRWSSGFFFLFRKKRVICTFLSRHNCTL